MEAIYKEYIHETFDSAGVLRKITFDYPRSFNFAFDVVDEIARRTPDALAMLWCDEDGNERAFSFREISELSNRAANVFYSVGIRKGDRVMLVLKRHYQFWYAMMGLCKIGALAIPATHLLTTHDFTYRFNAAGVSAIVCTAEGWTIKSVIEAETESPTLKYKMLVHGHDDRFLDFDSLIDAASPVFERPTGEQAVTVDDPMLLYFTSGTTGLPKMVWHRFDYPLAHIVTAAHWHCVERGKLHFTVAETGWGKAVWGKLYGQWFCEAPVFVYDFERFHATDVLERIVRYNISTFCAPPTIYRFFLAEDLTQYDLSGVLHATTAGEALNPEVYNELTRRTGLQIHEGFGQTETTLTACTLRGMVPKPGSMGQASPAYGTDIVDGEGKSCKPGEVGEIVLHIEHDKPVGLFGGYYKDPEMTAHVCREVLYHTGDMAWRDEDDFIWYVGRIDDLIKSSGYRIGPFEVESVLMEHPAVLECGVTGAPDPVRGQVVKATIKLNRGYEGTPELTKELQNYVKTHTASYKYPRIVEYVDELPKTISGKIRRSELRK